MAQPLHNGIHEKICSIQNALLRYKHEGNQMTLHVKITVDENDRINCIASQNLPSYNLINKLVVLIQKDHENYMYIGGRVSRQAQKNNLLLSIEIKKACWYVRKFKGSVSYLQEKFLYMPDMKIA